MTTERAKSLRKNQTEAERLLWNAVRTKRLDGYKFRRQHPIGPYIVDFICLECKLIVELDGGQHGEPDRLADDAIRTAWLNRRGYWLLRFWNMAS